MYEEVAATTEVTSSTFCKYIIGTVLVGAVPLALATTATVIINVLSICYLAR